MADKVTITSLELENVKRVRAVALTPAATGLTVIGGDNRQGKTSILDGICYALGGEKYRPTALQRDGGQSDARIEISLSNGLLVERKGKNAALKVTDTNGLKGGQKLLDAFVEELALDLPKFLAMSGKDKAGVLLRILGIGDRLAALDKEERAAYDNRTAQGRIADQKAHYAQELPEHQGVPEQIVSAAEITTELQAVIGRNADRQKQRGKLEAMKRAARLVESTAQRLRDEIERLEREIAQARERLDQNTAEAKELAANISGTTVEPDESTAEIQMRLADIEEVNGMVRTNQAKRAAIADAAAAKRQYDELTTQVEDVRARRSALLNGAAMPLAGLSVEQGELTYNGKAWDCMSASEQIRAGVAIVRKLKPACGFVLLDGLEAMDLNQLAELGKWLEAEGLQAIATRVSRGAECTIVIEDGMAVNNGKGE
jgi:DNA repair exonuclease SbcCD ATPase subunit